MKSGNLNFLEPSGPRYGCNGTALPFTEHVSFEVQKHNGRLLVKLSTGPNILCNFNSYLYVHTTEAIYFDTFSHPKFAKFSPTLSGVYYILVHAIKARGAWK
jgi:hypothetical protein